MGRVGNTYRDAIHQSSDGFALLVALYRDQKTNSAEGRKHRTPAQVMCGLLTLLMHWFPEKRFVFAGDSTYGSHEMARFAYRHRKRLTLVSKIVSDANFYEPPPKRIGKVCGRPRVKGAPCLRLKRLFRRPKNVSESR